MGQARDDDATEDAGGDAGKPFKLVVTIEEDDGDKQLELDLEKAVAFAVNLHRQGFLGDAAAIYQRILAHHPDQPDALHFLGLVRHESGETDDAIALIRRAIAGSPGYADAHNNLGNIFKELDRLDEAIECYRRAVDLAPANAAAYNNLGTALKDLGRFEPAIEAFEAAIRLSPKSPVAHQNLGNTYRKMGNFEAAVGCYRTAIRLNPDEKDSYKHLWRSLHAKKDYAGALEVLQEWRDRDPDNPVAQHLLAASQGTDVPARASDRFIQRTFDDFAGSFDTVLARLDYRGPRLIADGMARAVAKPDGRLAILDAGCGTGLCGPALRPYAATLIGVDLSAKMLAKAEGRDVYDELVEAELTRYVASFKQAFDVIVSGDTLVYFGALEPVFNAAAGALKPGGRLLFTVERAEPGQAEAGFKLNRHGRYSHTEAYVRKTLAAAGLTVASIVEVVLRKEIGEAVGGLLVIAAKE